MLRPQPPPSPRLPRCATAAAAAATTTTTGSLAAAPLRRAAARAAWRRRRRKNGAPSAVAHGVPRRGDLERRMSREAAPIRNGGVF
jgi:hypothetical protein